MAGSTGKRRRSTIVTSVPLTSISSGARIIDLLPLPIWLFIPIRVVIYAVKHWFVVALLALLLWLYTRDVAACTAVQSPTGGSGGSTSGCLAPDVTAYLPIVIGLTLFIPVSYFFYLWATNYTHSTIAVGRAALRLIQVRRSWKQILEAGNMDDGPKPPRMVGILPIPTKTTGCSKHWRPPRIANEYGTALTFTLNTSGINSTARAIEERREYIVNAIRAKRVRIRRLRPGFTELTIEWESNLSRSSISNSGDAIHSSQLPTVELDDGVEFELDNHLLVVGDSGSGKSNLIWHIKSNLNKFQIPHVLYVVDPKRVELTDMQHARECHRYADTRSDISRTIDDFHAMMEATHNEMKRTGTRKITFSADTPLHLLIVDELLLLEEAHKTDPTETKLGQILIAGRAAGFIVVGNSQLGQVDSIGRIRDLFPQRICMATQNSHITNAVLGPNAEERGARCSEITEAGTGYIYTDASGTFQRFRPPFIEDISLIARGGVWEPPETNSHSRTKKDRGAYVYTLWGHGSVIPGDGNGPDSDPNTPDRPLYVGKAINPAKRIKQHQENQPWVHDIDHSKTQISNKYPTEAEALEAEQIRIDLLKPLYNLSGRTYGDNI